jgi:hypothetical protein
MARRYRVTVYNQHAMCGVSAEGPSRPVAFKRALAKAGEPFLREGGDKLTTLRTLFWGHLMTAYYRTSRRASASHPIGAVVDFERID